MMVTNLRIWACFALFGLSILSSPMYASSNDVGSVIGFEHRQGLAVSGGVGIFFAQGGYKITSENEFTPHVPRKLSSPNAALSLMISHDVLTWLSAGVILANGYVSNAARVPDIKDAAVDYSLNTAAALLSANIKITPRLFFVGKVAPGVAIMWPSALPDTSSLGFYTGVAAGIFYDTLLPGMSVGLDAWVHLAFIPDTGTKSLPGILAFSITPVVKYVF